jgi:hypothetical protein
MYIACLNRVNNNLILMARLNIGIIPKRILSVTPKGSSELIKINLGYRIRDTIKTGLPQW